MFVDSKRGHDCTERCHVVGPGKASNRCVWQLCIEIIYRCQRALKSHAQFFRQTAGTNGKEQLSHQVLPFQSLREEATGKAFVDDMTKRYCRMLIQGGMHVQYINGCRAQLSGTDDRQTCEPFPGASRNSETQQGAQITTRFVATSCGSCHGQGMCR